MSQSFSEDSPLGGMREHENIEDAINQLKKDLAAGAEEVRITQPPKGVPIAEHLEKQTASEQKARPLVTMETLNDKLDALDRKINLIFGKHFLLNGKWIKDIKPEIGDLLEEK